MDEQNQQTDFSNSEVVSKDFDHDISIKMSANDESRNQLSENNIDVTNSEAVGQSNSLSTNGIDNELNKIDSKEDENLICEITNNEESFQPQENPSQSKENTLIKSPNNSKHSDTEAVNVELESETNKLCSENDKKECNNSEVKNISLVVSQETTLSNNENLKENSQLLNEQIPNDVSFEKEGILNETDNTVLLEEIKNPEMGIENDSSDLLKNNEFNENIEDNEEKEEENKDCLKTENQNIHNPDEEEKFSNEVEEIINKKSNENIEKVIESNNKMEVDGNFGVMEEVRNNNNNNNNNNEKNVVLDKNISEVSPKTLTRDVEMEMNDLQEEEKLEESNNKIEYKDKSFSIDSEFENAESEKEFQSKNDSVQELSSSSQINVNTSNEQDEENLNKSENDGTEVMDTEIINCNEIEQMEFIEADLQKDKEIDRIRIDLSDTEDKGENKVEELTNDTLEIINEKFEKRKTQKGAILLDDDDEEEEEEGEEINEPENSEEETITGDTTSQVSSSLAKNANEEICIIPDDMNPRLSILSQNETKKTKVKESDSENSETSEMKMVKETEKISDKFEKPKDYKNSGSKTRPVRNAAKLAGNKIKSLVESDLVVEERVDVEKEREGEIQENTDESSKMCSHCKEVKVCKFIIVQNDNPQYLCSDACSISYKNVQLDAELNEVDNTFGEFIRKCAQCQSRIISDDRCLLWETMDFCNEDCLGKYQTDLGSNCANCKGSVPLTSLGKYCVRFGYDVKQFCSASCLEEYKKGLKVCSYCQKDISTGTEGFLAPVGDKGQFKDFCTQACMEKYEKMSSNAPLPDTIEECAVCSNSKPVRVEVELDNKTHKLCSEPCFAAFKFVNNIREGQCDMCRKYFDRSKTGTYTLSFDENSHSFCCKTCMNVYILANRKIVPCNWCKVKKYNFDMIKKVSANGQLTMMCSLNCLMLYQVSVNAVCSRKIKCDFCMALTQAQYHLTMSDTTIRNFCSYNCVMSFQNRYPKQGLDILSGSDHLSSPIPTGGPKRVTPRRSQVESSCVPVISSVQSLASPNGPASPSGRVQIPRADVNVVAQVAPSLAITSPVAPMPAPTPQIYQQIITKPPPAKQMKNKSVLCKPYSHTKGVSCRPHPCLKETQTDQSLNRKFLIPIPVPIYVPAPMHMFATPFPVPVPFPLPVPVPIFIPTTRNSAKGIFKEIKKIQEKIPTDPFEAELLMMAEMVAGDKKQDPTDSESEDGNEGDDGGDGTFSPENVDTSNTFGDDMLQMALKMASELEEPAVDMESVLTSNTITTSTQPTVDPNKALYASDPDDPDQVQVMSMNRGRKRSVRGSRNSSGGTPSKRGRRTSGSVDVPLLPPPEPVPAPRIEVEKPDANMCLKYTFGVNAWRHWVMQKNAELEKAAMTNRKIKLFKPELLQLTADELNFSLCLFVKEVRKPNGSEYAPDTIYYLCLGIQQYLFENGRIDNIFTDSYYEKFTDCLDEVAKKFAALYNDSQYIVTRVEEEHLWESKQLGAHSPHVLLSTLMFFNTKHFNLVTVEEHMQLSFSHIMKHWKRNPNTPGVAKAPGSRNVLLRFYPPQSALEANSRKKKVYEQQENEENPLRCPVKLYEFYLSKCPESVKTRNDVFYLLPERSCVPDSPVWYSTMALGKEPLMKMLHRVKMVKEINIALLTC